MMPPLQSLTTKTVAPELKGGILGIYQSVISLAVIFSTAIAGAIFEVSPIMPFAVGGVLFMVSLLPAVFMWNWARRNFKRKNEMAVQPN